MNSVVVDGVEVVVVVSVEGEGVVEVVTMRGGSYKMVILYCLLLLLSRHPAFCTTLEKSQIFEEVLDWREHSFCIELSKFFQCYYFLVNDEVMKEE